MADRPTGTVTFLFTDIEGSTQLWEENQAEMQVALEHHDAILRSAIEQHGGYVFSTAGDAFAAAFARAGDALTVARGTQEALGVVSWPTPTPIRVRMGLHTGEAQERDGDYYGPALNRAARIMAAGHGGQVLISSTTAGVLGADGLVDLGEHRLRDLGEPERIFQLESGQLVETFPPLRTLEAVRHNLPIQRSELFGRDEEIAAVVDLLMTHRLVTLTGVGGAGKTRLGLAVAGELLDRFPDGVFFVALASVSDPAVIPSVVAEAAGLSLSGTALDSVAHVLADRDLLLVIDNCEHLIDDVADLVDVVLSTGERPRVIATSREVLEIEGEQTFTVPSLDTDSVDGPAVRLVLDRAGAGGASVALDDEAVEAVVEVCRRLDGIPLALELAAAHLVHMTPVELADRLDDRFRLLVGGRRRRLQRQQTLQAMMDWSWDLLDEAERALLAQLSVFAGGWTLDAAEGVCESVGADPVPVLLHSLVAKSLIAAGSVSGQTRYSMLETVRLYGLGKLLESGRMERARDRHAAYFCRTATEVSFADRFLDVPLAVMWRTELDNIRATVDWLRDQGRLVESSVLVTMPALAWRGVVPPPDLKAVIEQLLAEPVGDHERGLLLLAHAEMQWGEGDLAKMTQQAEAAEEVARGTRDDLMTAAALWLQGITHQASDPDRAENVLSEAARLADGRGEGRFQAAALAMAADAHSMGRRQLDVARNFVETARSLASATGFENLEIPAAECTIEILAGNWTAAGAALQELEQRQLELGIGSSWSMVVENAVIDAECGRPQDRPLTKAIAAIRADGGQADRPDLLTIPLGQACARKDWERAGHIIAAIRAAGRRGLSFTSPHTTALYLYYRNQVPRNHVPTTAAAVADVIRTELAQEATGVGGQTALQRGYQSAADRDFPSGVSE